MRFNGAPILVVDDEPGIRDLLKDNLEEQGYVCHTAPDGDAALNVLAEQTVQLALVDIMMPGMTGLSLFERVRERYPDLAVIFVTAWDDLNIAVQNLKNGAYDYVVKPVTRKRLQQAVERLWPSGKLYWKRSNAVASCMNRSFARPESWNPGLESSMH